MRKILFVFILLIFSKLLIAGDSLKLEQTPNWVQVILLMILIFLIIVSIILVLVLKKYEEKNQNFKQRELYLRRAMEYGNMGTYAVDTNKWTIEWSSELLDVLNISSSTKISLAFIRDLIHPEDAARVSGVFFNSIKLGTNFETECRVINEKEELKYVRLSGLFFKDDKGNLTKAMGIVQDITAQKLNDEQLIQAKDKAEESERLKSMFLANMSHEIRTPLNAIVGFSSLVGRKDIEDERRINFVKIIEKQNNLLLNLINDIIDFAKIESKSLQVNFTDDVELSEVIKVVYETFLPQCPDNVEFKINEDKLWGSYLIRTDEVRLKQILNNLVINAFKYTPSGKVEIGVYMNNAGNCLEIYVKDTGIGIPEAHQKHIFDRFHQVDQMAQGTGLGLAICKSLAQMLGGVIEFESSEKTGSDFRLILPVSVVQQTEGGIYTKTMIKDEIEVDSLDLSGKTILVAEDNIPNFLYLEELLSEKNASIKHAKNGVEAVEYATSADFDLILMDIKMPLKDGLQATREIRAEKLDVPIIAITAYAFDSDRVTSINAGCTDYISKPVDKEELFELISLVLS